MTSPSPAGPAASPNDWPEQVAGRIDSVVSALRDKTTRPVTLAARGIVYGIVVAALGAALFILLTISVIRLADVYLPIHPVGRRVWIVDGVAAAIFLLIGTFLWRKGRPRGTV